MKLLRQGSAFLMVGLAQLGLDWLLFVALTAAGVPLPPANVLARAGGMLLGFWLNGRYTFADGREHRLGWRRFVRFLGVWLLLTALSTVLVSTAGQQLGMRQAWLGKPLVEALLAAVSFLMLRKFVYR